MARARRSQLAVAFLSVGAAVLVAACGGEAASRSASDGDAEGRQERETDGTKEPRGAADGRQEPRLEMARCPANADNCESASGRVVFVEAVDPDGDGDAHFVLASTDSITAPGISVIDVRVDLRPDPLPKLGDRISAAGPVFPGSHGQAQIQAEVINFGRRR